MRFWSHFGEEPLCGHAIVSTVGLCRKLKLFKGRSGVVHCGAGRVEFKVEGEQVLYKQLPVEFKDPLTHE